MINQHNELFKPGPTLTFSQFQNGKQKSQVVNTLMPEQNDPYFATTFSNKFPWIKLFVFWLELSLQLIPNNEIDNK